MHVRLLTGHHLHQLHLHLVAEALVEETRNGAVAQHGRRVRVTVTATARHALGQRPSSLDNMRRDGVAEGVVDQGADRRRQRVGPTIETFLHVQYGAVVRLPQETARELRHVVHVTGAMYARDVDISTVTVHRFINRATGDPTDPLATREGQIAPRRSDGRRFD